MIIRQPEIYVDGVLVYGDPDPWLVDLVLDRLLSAFTYFGDMQVASLTLLRGLVTAIMSWVVWQDKVFKKVND